MTHLPLWHRAILTFSGLANYTLPEDPTERDRYIGRTIGMIHSGLERDVEETIRFWRQASGEDRARERRLYATQLVNLREARRLVGEDMRLRAEVRKFGAANVRAGLERAVLVG